MATKKKTTTINPDLDVELPTLRLVSDSGNQTTTQPAPAPTAAPMPHMMPYPVVPAHQPAPEERSKVPVWAWIVMAVGLIAVLFAILFVAQTMMVSAANAPFVDANSAAYKANETVNLKLDAIASDQATLVAGQGTLARGLSAARGDIASAKTDILAGQKKIGDDVAAFRKAIGGDVAGVRRKVEAGNTALGAIKASTDKAAADNATALDALRRELAKDRTTTGGSLRITRGSR